MKTFTAFALFLTATSYVSAGASELFHARNGMPAAARHRRHHARRMIDISSPSIAKRASSKKCKTKSKSKTASGSGSAKPKSKVKSGSSSSGSGNSTSTDCPSGSITVSGICVGMLPDGGSDGGEQDTMATLNNLVSSLNAKHAYFGQYAQAQSGTTFDGSQLLQVMDDLKASGAIFQPAVMPTGGWQGLTESDSSQAEAICNVMKQFTDEGITVWLRFAHEVNWYQTDGTYQGGVSDFQAGWAAVSKACKSIAPDVKMFFTPNVASESAYDDYFPTDHSTVDVIGIDYYPNSGTDLSSAFLSTMQSFHDKYCSDTTIFAIGETGLGYSGSSDQKVQWLAGMASAKSSMQYLHGISWFNYNKGYSFKVVDPNDSSTTSAYISWAGGN